MSQSATRPRKPFVELGVGAGYYLALSGKRALASLALIAGLIWCAWTVWQAKALEEQQKGELVLAANVGLSLLSVALGLVLAPSPRPTDYSHIAVVAVDEMAELNRATQTLINALDEVVSSQELSSAHDTKMKLALVQQELSRQVEVQRREVARWSTVAPGSDEEIVKGRQTAAAVLRNLEREQPSG